LLIIFIEEAQLLPRDSCNRSVITLAACHFLR